MSAPTHRRSSRCARRRRERRARRRSSPRSSRRVRRSSLPPASARHADAGTHACSSRPYAPTAAAARTRADWARLRQCAARPAPASASRPRARRRASASVDRARTRQAGQRASRERRRDERNDRHRERRSDAVLSQVGSGSGTIQWVTNGIERACPGDLVTCDPRGTEQVRSRPSRRSAQSGERGKRASMRARVAPAVAPSTRPQRERSGDCERVRIETRDESGQGHGDPLAGRNAKLPARLKWKIGCESLPSARVLTAAHRALRAPLAARRRSRAAPRSRRAARWAACRSVAIDSIG